MDDNLRRPTASLPDIQDRIASWQGRLARLRDLISGEDRTVEEQAAVTAEVRELKANVALARTDLVAGLLDYRRVMPGEGPTADVIRALDVVHQLLDNIAAANSGSLAEREVGHQGRVTLRTPG